MILALFFHVHVVSLFCMIDPRQMTCGGLTQNIDQTWHLSASDVELVVNPGFGTMKFTVDLQKDMILKGANLINFVASNLNVRSATSKLVTASSDLTFYAESLFTFGLPDVSMLIYYEGVQVGSAPLRAMDIVPGYNSILNQTLLIEKITFDDNTTNEDAINNFLEGYVAGRDQIVQMNGPVAGVGPTGKVYVETVLDGTLSSNITALGHVGDIAFGALTTSATQQGWKANGDTVRGAYANLHNPLNVPLNLTMLNANATMPVCWE